MRSFPIPTRCEVIEIVYPDGRQVGFMVHAGSRWYGSWWFGPYATIPGVKLT